MIGKTILHYKIIEKLGEGGMGVVYKAEDTRLERIVAIKFLPHHIAANTEERERFKIEAKAAAALNHPNIATIHAIEEADDEMFIVMEFIEGRELRKLLIENGQLSIDNCLNYAVQIAEGLKAAHAKGITHRDIKSSNIMVTESGQVKIMDFGLAKLAGQKGVTKSGMTVGTVAYMSPEQARGEPVDHRTDIWSLGVVLYEMLTGKLPFEGEYEQAVLYEILNQEPKPVQKHRPEIPPELQEIVSRALAKDLASRFSAATELLQELKAIQTKLQPSGAGNLTLQTLLRHARKPRFAIPAVLIVAVLCFFAVRYYNAGAKIHWARNTALPEIARLLEKQKLGEAFSLARQAQRYIPDDPMLRKLLLTFSIPVWIKTTPPGAEVYCKNYLSVDAEWEYLGRTPLDSVHAQPGYLRWKIIKEGFEPIEWAFTSWFARDVDIKLDTLGAGPANMVHVPGGTYRLWSADPVELSEYWIDKYEVTNQEYKAFVDAGGYQNRAYWKHSFMMQDRTLSWEEAMVMFRDKTNQPGPSTWELGSFPEGRADYPVGGISWYETAAYAEFAGKSLPTVYHWYKAFNGRDGEVYGDIAVLSNFKSKGPARVGQYQGLGGVGTYEMAGNVMEWCWNQAGKMRYILGGAWNDPEYMSVSQHRQMPFDRSETNGFRCVKYTAELTQAATKAIDPVSFSRDFTKEKPVSDEIFQIYKSYFLYDSTALNAVVESVDESMAHWRRETVTFDAAYGNERVIAHLFLPKNAVAPYQTVIYFPGSEPFLLGSSENLADMTLIDFIPRTGRALVYPVYKDKRHAIFDGGHVTPMNDVIKETLTWLDRYLGPVQRQAQSSEK